MKIFYALIIMLGLLATNSVFAARWSEYRSENFSIYSDEKESKVTSILHDFEQFRKAVLLYMNLPDKPENQRMMVMMYANKKQFAEISPNRDAAGFYMNSNAGPRMVIGPASSFRDSSVILYHEYAHYLIREHSSFVYPKWYDEGLAEFLASAVVKNDKVLLGALHPWRSYWMKMPGWTPISELISVPSDKRGRYFEHNFYASSWLFVHYLEFGSVFGHPDYNAKTKNYLIMLNKGEDPVTSFPLAYGITIEQMQKEINKYRRQRFTQVMSFPVGAFSGSIQRRVLSANEENYILADLNSLRGNEDKALKYLASLDVTKPDAARGISLQGILKNHMGFSTSIDADMQRIAKSAQDDPAVSTNLSHYYWDKFTDEQKKEKPSEELMRDSLSKVVFYANQAIENDAASLEAHFFLADAYRVMNQIPEAINTLMAAYKIHPTHIGINFTLGSYLSRTEPEVAVHLLQRALRWAHDEHLREEIMKILDDAQDRISSNQTLN